MNERHRTITDPRWALVPWTVGSGLHIGVGDKQVFPNAVGVNAHGNGAAQLVAARLDRLTMVADNAYDFVVLGDAMRKVAEPRAMLAEAWRVTAEGGFLLLVQPTGVYFDWLTKAARDHALMATLTYGPNRVDVIGKLPRGQGRLDARLRAAEGQKTCAIMRPGAYGDAFFAASLAPSLKREGYHVTVYTGPQGEEVLRHDPHVDAIVVFDGDRVPLANYGAWCAHEKPRYDRWIHLVESVEKNLIAVPNDLRFFWPDAERRRIFDRSYLEAVHDLAEVPHSFEQRFYPDANELARARGRRVPGRRLAVLAASGSTLPKFWPYLEPLADALIARGFTVTIVGDLRGQAIAGGPHLHVVGEDWPIRDAMALAQQADIVIGQDTALLHSVAMEPMPKIVLLSITSRRNLTTHWVNTAALAGAAPCFPCHRLHLKANGWGHCNRHEATGAALCQAMITVDEVLEEVDRLLPAQAAA